MINHLSFSIVVSTNGRRDSLLQTLDSFQYLDYPNFEVCVIPGPTPDGTVEMLQDWGGRIKTLPCSTRNISASRNLGIGIAAGDIVAFIDDDAIPESDWLAGLNEAYQDARVTAAGGFVYNPDGVSYQWRYGTTDRLGRAEMAWQQAVPEFNFPLSVNFPHLLGTNSSARRSAAVEIGGFDEAYEYYLDETDFLCRLVDAGGYVAQVAGASVHHKFRPSHIRDETRLVKNWYPIIRNKIFYSLVNNQGHYPLATVFEDVLSQIRGFKSEIDQAISIGRADKADRERFDEQVEQAWRDGLAAGLTQQRKLRSEGEFSNLQQPFLPFRTFKPVGRRKVFCFLSGAREVGRIDSIDEYTRLIAATLSKMGHETHVFACGDQTTVDFEGGVWVHRIEIALSAPSLSADGVQLPTSVRNGAPCLAQAVRAFAAHKSIDAAFAPLWGCEGFTLRNDDFALVAVLSSASRHCSISDPELLQASSTRDTEISASSTARSFLNASKLVMAESEGLVDEAQSTYGLVLETNRLVIVPSHANDWRASDRAESETVRLLHVDASEMRQRLDALLQALEAVS